MGNFLSEFPERKALLEWYKNTVSKIDNTGSNGKITGKGKLPAGKGNNTSGKGKIAAVNGNVPAVNGHIHSPYSFSAFDDLEQAFRMASDEGVKVLGINDFNSTKGYDLFHDLSLQYKVFPLFNIEFMGLLEGEQKKGIRINDPNNPGRIYFSGKGLDYPVSWKEGSRQKVQRIIDESHRQVRAMTDKLNGLVQNLDPAMQLDFDDIEKRYTRGMVRERHLARSLREMLFERLKTEEAIRAFLNKLYGNSGSTADINDSAALENEIRGRLLKAGGAAFVEEDAGAFLNLEEITGIITDGGGVPCYPVLLDDASGNFTEFEADPESLYQVLRSRGVFSIELIPGRNDLAILKKFVSFFRERDFVVLYGTEHNTPSLDPVTVSARGGAELDRELMETSYLGACVIAAHQYLRAKGETGYVSFPGREIKKEFEELGKAVIERFIKL